MIDSRNNLINYNMTNYNWEIALEVLNIYTSLGRIITIENLQ